MNFLKRIKHVHDTGAYRYADGVLSGDYKTGKLIYKACKRFMSDLKRDDIYLDLDTSRKVINYPRLLKHWKGPKAGTPIVLELYQEFYFQQMFGWRRTDGLRRFTRSFKEIARKNGKTTELAIQGLYHCDIDMTSGPQFYVGATKEDQARLTLRDAENIIPGEWVTDGTFKIYKTGQYPREILIPRNKGSLNTVGRDSKRADGLDVSFAGIDEYHEHPDTSIRDILASAQGNRIEPLESIITTAGYNINGPCYTKSRDTGIKILDGVLKDDQQLVVIYEMDDWDDWQNQDEWICANPMMDSSPSLKKDLKDKFERAVNEGGSTEVDFKTKRLNMWVNSPETWIPYEIIKKNNHGILDNELLGKECYAGLDLSAGTDLNAYVLFFPNVRENTHAVKAYFWIPEEKLLSKEADYNSFKNHLEVFDGNTVEYKKIANTMLQSLEKYNVKSWGCDPAYLATGPAQFLWEAGKADLIEKVSQGRNLAAATNSIESWAYKEQLDFMENPVMFWNFTNVIVAQTENGHKYPSKKKSEQKIDGVAALCTAVHEYLRLGNEPPPNPKRVIFI